MPYVSRDAVGNISGQFRHMQPTIAEEYLEPDDPELLITTVDRADIEGKRLKAYADPIKGSDRYVIEAMRCKLEGKPEWEQVMSLGAARILEIKKEYPWEVL
jgi:hypothetical protein